jgi:hypothetical protein
MVQRGKRAVYDADANAYEKATPTNEDEFRRKVRMFEHCWAIVLEGKMLRRLRPLYFVEVVSHRHLRYASGLLHILLLVSSILLVGHGAFYAVALGLQLGILAAAPPSTEGCRATCSSRGRRWQRCGTTFAAACPHMGSSGRDDDERHGQQHGCVADRVAQEHRSVRCQARRDDPDRDMSIGRRPQAQRQHACDCERGQAPQR